MEKVKIEKISPEVKEAHKFFAKQSGSQNITTVNTLQVLYEIFKTAKMNNIIELGGGIGTIDYFCLKYSDTFIDICEDNDFCIKKIHENLSHFKGRYLIHHDKNNFSFSCNFYDLVIVDGAWENSVDRLVKQTERLDKILFEGRRAGMQLLFLKELKQKYVVKYKRFYNDFNNYKNGYLFECKLNNNRIIREINYFYNRCLYEMENMRIYGTFNHIKNKLYKYKFFRVLNKLKKDRSK